MSADAEKEITGGVLRVCSFVPDVFWIPDCCKQGPTPCHSNERGGIRYASTVINKHDDVPTLVLLEWNLNSGQSMTDDFWALPPSELCC